MLGLPCSSGIQRSVLSKHSFLFLNSTSFYFAKSSFCTCDAKVLSKAKNPMDLCTELARAHGAILFAGVDHKLGRIDIRERHRFPATAHKCF